MLAGPDFETLALLAASVEVPTLASGGVTTLEDIDRLSQLGLAGCIIGRALYEGRLALEAAIQVGANMP
jgi:phosphoribosylformimino-5-aminoimidazole carboxamide ribotide isomerase